MGKAMRMDVGMVIVVLIHDVRTLLSDLTVVDLS